MLPEAVKRIMNNKYIHLKGEDTSFSHLSIEQLNNHFQKKLREVNRGSAIYRHLKADNYYVIAGLDVDEPGLVRGSFFLDFTISLPSLDDLKNKVKAQGVPALDKGASACALEILFDHELSSVQEEMRRYVRYICSLHELTEVTRDILFCLFHKISEMRSIHLVKLQHSGIESHRRFYSRTVKELDTQVSLLLKILRDKGP